MKDRVFNSKDLPWINHENGKSKLLLGRSFLGSASLRIYCLAAGSKIETHEHSFIQVMYFTVNSDSVVIIDEEREYNVTAGLVVVVKPNQCHKIINNSDEDLEILVIESFKENNQSTPFVDF